MDYKEILTPLQISKIEQFNGDTDMKEAVKQVLLAGLYEHGVVKKGKTLEPRHNGAYSMVALATNNPIPDEIIGQQLRAQWAGINALENAFQRIEEIKSKKKEKVESPFNVAI